jgi:hypothetical protein
MATRDSTRIVVLPCFHLFVIHPFIEGQPEPRTSAPVWRTQSGNPKYLWAKGAGTYRSAPGWAAFVRKDAATGDSTARIAVVCAKR